MKDELILPQGWIAGQWVWGTTLYLGTLLTVLAKAALISECVKSRFSSSVTLSSPVSPRQHLDEIYAPRHPRVVPLHDGLPSPLRVDRPARRLVHRVPEYRPATVVVARVLAHHLRSTGWPPPARLWLEVVRLPFYLSMTQANLARVLQLQTHVPARAVPHRAGDPEVQPARYALLTTPMHVIEHLRFVPQTTDHGWSSSRRSVSPR